MLLSLRGVLWRGGGGLFCGLGQFLAQSVQLFRVVDDKVIAFVAEHGLVQGVHADLVVVCGIDQVHCHGMLQRMTVDVPSAQDLAAG